MNSINFWTDQRLQRILLSCLAAIFLSSLIVFFNDQNSTSALKRGDFPAFYVAATIIKSNQSLELYNQALQQEIENTYWPSFNGGYYSFAYPPYFAAVLAPLAYLSPQSAKLVFMILNLVLLAISIKIASQFIPLFRKSYFKSFLSVLLFAPLLHGLLSGQNVAISIFLYTCAIYFLVKEEKIFDFIAGLFLGFWLYKPHFVMVIICLLVFRKQWVVIAGIGVVALVNYLVGVYLIGWNWLCVWLSAVKIFAVRDFQFNGHQMISLPAFIENFFSNVGHGLSVNFLIMFFGVILGLVFIHRQRNSLNVVDSLCIFIPWALLISPHALYYDLGLSVIPFARFLDGNSDRQISFLLVWNLLMYVLVLTRDKFSFSPFFFILLLVNFWIVRSLLIKNSGQLLRAQPNF